MAAGLIIVHLVVCIDKKKLFSLVSFFHQTTAAPAYLFAAVHKTKWNFKDYFNCPKNTSIFHFILGSDGFLHIYRIKRTN